MKNFDNFIYNKNTLPQDENEKTLFFKKLEEQLYNELLTSEKAKEYLDKFHPSGIEYFLKSYVQKKVELIKRYEHYQYIYSENENNEIGYQKRAEEMLCAILQKKLFNMQLLWRANKLDIKEIHMSYDFHFWGRHILSCPFLPVITENEIDLMKEFLLQADDPDGNYRYNIYDWQDYDDLVEKDEYGDHEYMPEWYNFYDIHMGTASLLILPDVRGKREEFYRDLVHEDNRIKNPSLFNSPTPSDDRPYFTGYGQPLVDFSHYVETDKHIIELFKYLEFEEKQKEEKPDNWELRDAVDVLVSADRPIYFDSNLNWDKAIFTAVFKYENRKIAETLDFVYEEYLLLKNLGFSKDENPEEIAKAYQKDEICKIYRECILKGRVLNGEPPDFNY